MKKRIVIFTLTGLMAIGMASFWAGWLSGRPAAEDLLGWTQAAGNQDWTDKAARGDAEAQFYLGLSLVRTNLVIMRDSVPGLAGLPLVGRRFRNTQVAIDDAADPDQLREAFQWIGKSANQNYAPARTTQKLFANKIAELDRGELRHETAP